MTFGPQTDGSGGAFATGRVDGPCSHRSGRLDTADSIPEDLHRLDDRGAIAPDQHRHSPEPGKTYPSQQQSDHVEHATPSASSTGSGSRRSPDRSILVVRPRSNARPPAPHADQRSAPSAPPRRAIVRRRPGASFLGKRHEVEAVARVLGRHLHCARRSGRGDRRAEWNRHGRAVRDDDVARVDRRCAGDDDPTDRADPGAFRSEPDHDRARDGSRRGATGDRAPPTTPLPTEPPATVPGSALALDVLATIPVEREQPSGYDRDLFHYGDTVDDHGCRTRALVLMRDSLTPAQVDAGACAVIAGDWYSRYDGAHVDGSGRARDRPRRGAEGGVGLGRLGVGRGATDGVRQRRRRGAVPRSGDRRGEPGEERQGPLQLDPVERRRRLHVPRRLDVDQGSLGPVDGRIRAWPHPQPVDRPLPGPDDRAVGTRTGGGHTGTGP